MLGVRLPHETVTEGGARLFPAMGYTRGRPAYIVTWDWYRVGDVLQVPGLGWLAIAWSSLAPGYAEGVAVPRVIRFPDGAIGRTLYHPGRAAAVAALAGARDRARNFY